MKIPIGKIIKTIGLVLLGVKIGERIVNTVKKEDREVGPAPDYFDPTRYED